MLKRVRTQQLVLSLLFVVGYHAALYGGIQVTGWQVISAGGSDCKSDSYAVAGTAAQLATERLSLTDEYVDQGFWYSCMASCMPGDADGSESVDIDDVVYLVNHIFVGSPAPVPHLCCGDANGSCGIDIDDVVYLIAHIFTGGSAPVPICLCNCRCYD